MTRSLRHEYESRCLFLQEKLDSAKTSQERNAKGQFSTPTTLAKEIVTYAIHLVRNETPLRFLDPAIGTGSFYSALCAIAPANRIETAEGFEIDPHYGLPAQRLWKQTTLNIHVSDFATAVPPKENRNCFNLLICNPPYVRHHHISRNEKIRLQIESKRESGVRITGLAGLYCYFLVLSHTWMSECGVAAWLIPSEFMDVNYGEAIKQYLLENVNLVRIHRFDPNDVQFGDAIVSSAVVFFRKESPPSDHQIDFTFGGTLT